MPASCFIFEVAAVLSPDAELLSADLVLLSKTISAASLPIRTSTTPTLRCPLPTRSLEVRNIAVAKLTATLPDSRPILREEAQRTYQSIFDWREGILLTVLAGAILAFVILSWEKASGLSAEEKREIGILKALGWDTGDVIRMKMGRTAHFPDRIWRGFPRRLRARLPLWRKLFEPVLKAVVSALSKIHPAARC